MITIHKAILHILDFQSGLTVFSEEELDLGSDSIFTFLTKHLERASQDQQAQPGEFYPESSFLIQVQDYFTEQLDFVEFSRHIAELLYKALSQSDALVSTDLLVCDAALDDARFLAILLCNNRVGFTHQVNQAEGKVRNEIIHHYAILPGLSQKIDEYALISVDPLAIRLVEKKRSMNGQEALALSEQVLQCSTKISPQETVKLVSTIAKTVAENHGESAVAAVSRAKSFMVENTELSDYLDPSDLSREIFPMSPMLQAEYLKEVQEAGITEKVKLDKEFTVKKGRNHKIKTDTGIELSFPVDYFDSKEFIEFINNPDGTISISLKNIGKIVNK
ncbi:MAG: nucleoid-associated protein [Sporomusaceae bacterium]|nr:nucleoid-associated protein [Sporomusaceae bacterium]